MQQLSVHTRLAINVMLIMLTWGRLMYPSVFGSLHPTTRPRFLLLDVIHTGDWPQVVEHILGNNVTIGATWFLKSPHLQKRLPGAIHWESHLFLYSLPFLRLGMLGEDTGKGGAIRYCIYSIKLYTTNKKSIKNWDTSMGGSSERTKHLKKGIIKATYIK